MKATRTLYPYILSRHSIRSYKQKPLEEMDCLVVKEILGSIKPLFSENRFEVILKDRRLEENIPRILGAYGRLIIAPHYLVPYLAGNKMPLVDLGFRVEQIAVHLWAAGIGTCYIGCISRIDKVREILDLSKDSWIGAFLVLGYPANGFGLQTITSVMKRVIGSNGRKPVEEIFFMDSFTQPATPPMEWRDVIEAARFAPSAVNAQPWRLLLSKRNLYLFVLRNNRKYYFSANQDYCFYDGGICMANMELALDSQSIKHQWHLYTEDFESCPPHPDSLFPIARLSLSE